MDSPEDKETVPELEPEGISVVAVPTAVFLKILERLAAQPYQDVGQLMNVLVELKAQIVAATEG